MNVEEKQIAALLKLGCTEEEARQVLEDDKQIDKGKDLFPLSAEQEQVAKQMRRAPRAVSESSTPTKRTRKPCEPKRFLIDSFATFLRTLSDESGNSVNSDSLNITNPEREIIFTFGETKYKIVLSAPRK